MQDEALITQLERLVRTGGLPNNVQASTALLLGRLQTVINVRVMGPDRDQKTGLIAAFAGCHLPDVASAEIWLQYGEETEVVLHYHDGSSVVLTPEMEHYDPYPVRIDVAAPIEALSLVSFHLVGDLDAASGPRLKGSHAFQDADIVLWCTSRFDPSEAAQWSSAPERLKDHSFLVCFNGPLSLPPSQQTALEQSVEEEFYAVRTINLDQSDHKSAKELLADIFQIATSGRRADEDGAALLLKTYETLLKVAIDTLAAADVVAQPTSRVYSQALSLIENCARQVADPLPEDDRTDLAKVLITCAETSQELAELFDNANESGSDYEWLKRDVLMASDQLTLMTMEKGVQPAIDAVTTLVQLKRDIELRCAA
ncbi:MAG: hypothetical protein AAGA08_08450 [Pseudomonadota bacterium]